MTEVIDFVGEYGIEVGVFIPYIHYLKSTGKFTGKKIITYEGMKPYYYFLDDGDIEYKKEVRQHRVYRYPNFPEYFLWHDNIFLRDNCVLEEYLPPDFYNFYKNQPIHNIIQSNKPIIIINNKFNLEWYAHMPPQNFFSIDELRKMLNILTPHYTIVYSRPGNHIPLRNYAIDDAEVRSVLKMEERQMIETEFKEVLLIEKLIEKTNIEFNELKCILNANAVATITVLGGTCFFDAYFPSKHIVYCKYRPECNPYLEQPQYQAMHNKLCPNNHSELLFAKNEATLLSYIHSLVP